MLPQKQFEDKPDAAIDPVCGMTVQPEKAAGSFDYDGQIYYFCSTHCLNKFKANPESSLKQAVQITDPRPTAVQPQQTAGIPVGDSRLYTCPMHPQIVRDKPGNCPICGMALEPRTVSFADEENPELVDMTRRFWVGVVLTVPLLLIAMSDFVPGNPLERIVSMRSLGWVQFVLATPVVIWGGWPFFVRGWQSIMNRSLNMFTLIGLGVAVAYVFSVIAKLFPEIFPSSFRDAAGGVPVYF
ncbi:MAG TPA: heavy metal-binding domain-containing protein, partial [Pyrinomonadaceae bacterium]|nr:heavy metal-binding domain-containing protein [Pyrinomonadaceae bacterium]